MDNIYGAVPEALERTRLTLRDIMQDYLGQKILESKLNLAKVEMGAEREAVALEAEKAKGLAEVSLAKVTAEKDWRTQRLGIEETRLGELTRHQKAMEGLAGERIEALKGGQVNLDEMKTVEEWADLGGLTPTQKDIFLSYYPAGSTLKRRDVNTIQENLRKNPLMSFKMQLLGNIDMLEELQGHLKNPKLNPEERSGLEKGYDKLYQKTTRIKRTVDYMDKGKTKLTPEEMTELKDEALMYWDAQAPDEIKAEYGNKYSNFEKAFIKDYLDLLKQGSLELEKLKRKPSEEEALGKKLVTYKLDAKDEKWFTDKLNQVEETKGPEAAQRAFDAVARMIAAKDIAEAKKLLQIVLGEYVKEEAPEVTKRAKHGFPGARKPPFGYPKAAARAAGYE